MPPCAEITMVALDEDSAARADSTANGGVPALVTSNLFVDPTQTPQDTATLESNLVAKGYRFHTFVSQVFLNNSLWSTQ